jgi:hypothetical protein
MTTADQRRLDRLARRAKQLDDVIQKAAQMQKQIVEQIRRIGVADRRGGPRARKKR